MLQTNQSLHRWSVTEVSLEDVGIILTQGSRWDDSSSDIYGIQEKYRGFTIATARPKLRSDKEPHCRSE